MRKNTYKFGTAILLIIFALTLLTKELLDNKHAKAASQTQPLKVDSQFNHYYVDSGSNKMLLAGNSGNSFQLKKYDGQPAKWRAEIDSKLGDSSTALDDLNYIRLWTTLPWRDPNNPDTAAHFAWKEISKNYYDLTQYDSTYWSNLRDYVSYAQSKGVYIDFILFDECGLEGTEDGKLSIWQNHPFHPSKNNNNLGLRSDTGVPSDRATTFYDPWGNGKLDGLEKIQKLFIDKVAFELKDYNNVLIEATNEYQRGGETWENQVSNYVKSKMQELNRSNSSYWQTQIVTVNHLNSSNTNQWSNSNINGYNFHETDSVDNLAGLMKNFYLKGKPIMNNESSASSNRNDLIKTTFGMFTTGGHVAFDDSNDGPYEIPTLGKLLKFVRGVEVDGDSRKGVRFWEMVPNNAINSSSPIVKSTPGSSKAYTLMKKGYEYVILLTGSSSSTGEIGIDLTGLPSNMTYKAVSYNPDSTVTSNEYKPLSVNFSTSGTSKISGIPSFSVAQVVYLRAIQNQIVPVPDVPNPPVPTDQSLISGISQSGYINTHLKIGDKYYIDRDYTIAGIPSILDKSEVEWIKTRNDDKSSTGTSFLNFNISKKSYVYIAYDERVTSYPNWLADWETVDDNISLNTVGYKQNNLKRKLFNAGKVVLGGNMDTGASGSESMYFVGVEPIPDLLSNLQINSSAHGSYEITNLKLGDKYYTDRDYVIKAFPQDLGAADVSWIKTANNDKTKTENPFLTFNISSPAYVYVIYSPELAPLPSWYNEWTLVDETLLVTDSGGSLSNYLIRYKYFAVSDQASIPGNAGSWNTSSNYIVAASASQKILPTVQVTLNPNVSSIYPGGQILYTLKVKNNSSKYREVAISNPIDTQALNFVRADRGGKFKINSKTSASITWPKCTLSPGQEESYTYLVQVK